jgi:hypothetical protein
MLWLRRNPQNHPLEVGMAGRSRSSFNKRQKERSRQDKQREKLEKRQQRKAEKQSGVPGENDDFGQNDFSLAGDYEEPEELTIANSNADD